MDLRTYLETTNTSQAEFARRIGVTPGRIWQWLNEPEDPGNRITAERAVDIERETGGKVSRADLRPDLFDTAS